jgi:hypothetical protein
MALRILEAEYFSVPEYSLGIENLSKPEYPSNSETFVLSD